MQSHRFSIAKMTNTDSELIDQLKKACDGLLCMSESEYPFEVFLWEIKAPLTPEKLLQQTNHPQNTPIEVVDIDKFFEVATTPQDWYGEEENSTMKKYQFLVEILKQNLSNLEVYRLCERKIDVYIVGQTNAGNLAGLSTKVVET
ncbi:MAG TPA: nuclease A inhibitor family protein [Candidatus Obscuribacterales bacterium]